jgi:hypothetical protein
MESSGHEHMESLFKVLTETLRQDRQPAGQDVNDTDWVIERIQDSFDSRAG